MKQLQQIACEDPVRRLKFSHDGSYFLAVSLYDVISYPLDGKLENQQMTAVGILEASYINRTTIVVSRMLPEQQHALILYDLQTGREIANVMTNDVRSLCVDPQRGRILAGSLNEDGMGGYLDCYDFTLHRQSRSKTNQSLFDMAISHLGKDLAAAGWFFELWDLTNDPIPRIQEYPPDGDCTGYLCEVCAVDLTPDGRYALGGIYGAKAACFIVETATGNITGWYGPDGSKTYLEVNAAAISPDGKFVAVAFDNRATVDVYRVSDNTIFHQFEARDCRTIAFSPQGNVLAFADVKSISLWEFESE
jgi:WD40 repeat protein